MKQGNGYLVYDHTGAFVARFGDDASAVELAEKYAKRYGVADVVHGKKKKRILSNGRVFHMVGGRWT